MQALKCQNLTGKVPLWLMRQAGRYLPEYRALREKHSLMTLFSQPELAAEITLQPLRRYPLDAAIVFADILLVLQQFGVKVSFEEGVGPILDPYLKDLNQIRDLPEDPSATPVSYVAETIKNVRQELTVPLIGFCGAPFTVASYWLDNTLKQGHPAQLRTLLYEEPNMILKLLHKITQATENYLDMQIKAGVQAIQIFESSLNMLSPPLIERFVLPFIRSLICFVQNKGIPVILFARGSCHYYPLLSLAEPQALSLDWEGDLHQISKTLPKSIAIQGNLDPALLYASPDKLEEAVTKLLTRMQGHPGFIFNLGHGMQANMHPDQVQRMVKVVTRYRGKIPILENL